MVDLSGDGDWIIHGDNACVLPLLPSAMFRLIYIDPPFNTGREQRRASLTASACKDGRRTGFGGRRYSMVATGSSSFKDRFEDYIEFIRPRLEEAHRLLTDDGTFYFHIDYREAHYCKLLLDEIFGRECFLNEIIWAYDFGGKPKRRWPAKHDTILVYVRNHDRYFFDQEAVERIPYMAPGLVSPEKAARGKIPTDVWWHTIVPTSGSERTGYATQKPEGVLRRIISASSQPDDWVLDFFGGSGTVGAVARQLGRRFVLVDDSAEAVAVMRRRLGSDQIRFAEVR